MLDGYVPLSQGEMELYRSIREAVPIVDAALRKLVRLAGGVKVSCRESAAQEGLDWFLQHVNTGRGQRGIQSFLDGYLDSMLTFGRAVGRSSLTGGAGRSRRCCAATRRTWRFGRGVAAGVYPVGKEWGRAAPGAAPAGAAALHPLSAGGGQPLRRESAAVHALPDRNPAEHLPGDGDELGADGQRALRGGLQAGDAPLEQSMAQERSRQIAREWSAAMEAGRDGRVRDFVAVGDVDIKVIGADNQVLDSEVPVRQILEQLVARTGIPPFLLGLSWSSTERMSTQQADMMTSELTAIRRGWSLWWSVSASCGWPSTGTTGG
ncbi:serine/threonine protein phosphatase [Flavonifractor plautii]|nr:serine/threonine protein phosphatase [Flavonifractor plautii]